MEWAKTKLDKLKMELTSKASHNPDFDHPSVTVKKAQICESKSHFSQKITTRSLRIDMMKTLLA